MGIKYVYISATPLPSAGVCGAGAQSCGTSSWVPKSPPAQAKHRPGGALINKWILPGKQKTLSRWGKAYEYAALVWAAHIPWKYNEWRKVLKVYLRRRSSDTVSLWRPLARREANTLRPLADSIRLRNPCTDLRLRRCGWYVRFILLCFALFQGSAKVIENVEANKIIQKNLLSGNNI